MTENKTPRKRRMLDFLITGTSLGVIVEGAIRIANNPPEFILNINNLKNTQYQFGALSVVLGGTALAYGITRIAKYIKEQ